MNWGTDNIPCLSYHYQLVTAKQSMNQKLIQLADFWHPPIHSLEARSLHRESLSILEWFLQQDPWLQRHPIFRYTQEKHCRASFSNQVWLFPFRYWPVYRYGWCPRHWSNFQKWVVIFSQAKLDPRADVSVQCHVKKQGNKNKTQDAPHRIEISISITEIHELESWSSSKAFRILSTFGVCSFCRCGIRTSGVVLPGDRPSESKPWVSMNWGKLDKLSPGMKRNEVSAALEMPRLVGIGL